MISDSAIYLLGQSAVIIGAVIATYVSTRVAIAKLQEKQSSANDKLDELKADHQQLKKQVTGISTVMTRMQVQHERCPYANGSRDSKAAES